MPDTTPAATFARLVGFLRPFWRGVLLSVLLGAATTGASIGLMATSAWMISKAGLQPSIADLGVSVVGVRFFGLMRGVLRYLERLVSHGTTFRVLAHLRVWFYSALEPLAPARLAEYRSGDLLARVVADIETLQNFYLRVLAPPLVAVLTVVGVGLLFLAFDPVAALTAVAAMIFAGTALPLLAWYTGQVPGRVVVQARAELNTALVEDIQGAAEITAYNRQGWALAALDDAQQGVEQAETRSAQFDALQTFLGVLAVNAAALAVLMVAIPRVDGIFLATLTLTTVAAFETITPLAQSAQQLGANVTAAERLFEVVSGTPAVVDPPGAASPQDASLRFEDVVFRYHPADPPALSHLTLNIASGERVAVVGASGAGKSTLVNVLARFWEYESGAVWVGGQPLRAYRQADVRQMIGVMTQRTHLFNTTIRENIRIARPDATDADIEHASEQARIHGVVMSLAEGYDTLVGEGGLGLSGGQRQRLALARVFLKNAPILILDEATANLDAVNEREIVDALLAGAHGRTLVMLTHRLTLLEAFDRIIVMDGGRVVEAGTHADLRARAGTYRSLLLKQVMMPG